MPPTSPFSGADIVAEQIKLKQEALVDSAIPRVSIHGQTELSPHLACESQN